MESRKFVRLLAILALVAIMGASSNPVEKDVQKSAAQLYYDQFPVESKCILVLKTANISQQYVLNDSEV